MKALIFDLDGVIVATHELHFRSWQRLASEEGLDFDRAVNVRLLGRTREDSLGILLGGREIGKQARDDMLARKQAYFLAEAECLKPDDILSGVVDLLDEADHREIPCAVASSSRNATLVLDKLALTHRFAVIADGNSGVKPKPCPDVFLWVASQLGVNPRDTIVFEDSPAGLAAARAGGFAVAAVSDETPLIYWSFANLAALVSPQDSAQDGFAGTPADASMRRTLMPTGL